MAETVRLNKYLAHTLGISRREADAKIAQGTVSVNGHIVDLGKVIQPGRDRVAIDNAPITTAVKHYTYLLMNKPIGYVCSRKQQGEASTIYSLLPHYYQHLKVAGRLDKDSQGLLLLTDDGDVIFQLTHPKFGKEKIYYVGLNKPLSAEHLKTINNGVELEDGISKLAVIKLKSKQPNRYQITMREGRNRQIRRTFKTLGYSVTFLERRSLGVYTIEELSDNLFLPTRNKYIRVS